jgi:HK97 family phage major capsid protein
MDLEKTLSDGLDVVKSTLSEQVKSTEARLEQMQAKAHEEITNIGKAHGETLEVIQKLEKNYTSLKERQDAFETTQNRLKGGQSGQTFAGQLKEALKNNAGKLASYGDTKNVSFEVKATMTQADNLTGEVIEPTRVPGVKFDPERAARVRQFLPNGTTTSNAIFYTRESDFTDNTNITAEGTNKPENDLDLTQETASVSKIAATFRVSEEMLNDIDYLASHIALRGVQKYNNKEDQQLLYGTGQSGQLEGLTVAATDYALDAYTESTAQEYDILIQALKQLRNGNYNPSAAMISVKRYFDMISRKDVDGQYVMPEGVIFGTSRPTVLGVPIVATNALADDDFLVGDFPMMTTLFDREGVNVRFYEQDRDNVQKNLVTVVIEGRLALPTYLPGAGRYGNFAAAIKNAGNS